MADRTMPTIGQTINGHTVVALAFDESDPGDTVPVILLRHGAPNFGESAYVVARWMNEREWQMGQYVSGDDAYARAWFRFCERMNAPELPGQ